MQFSVVDIQRGCVQCDWTTFKIIQANASALKKTKTKKDLSMVKARGIRRLKLASVAIREDNLKT